LPRPRDAAARVAREIARPAEAMWFRAPGRVNLLGDHTDYNDGFVLPMAIDRACVVAAHPSPVVRVRSLDRGGAVAVAADATVDASRVEPRWGRYVAAVVDELAALGRPHAGVDAVLASDVPLGSGLSSSAALEVAIATTLAAVADWALPARELAAACRTAEERATGVAGGIMDQLTSLCGRAGHALLIDCRSLEIRYVLLPDHIAVLAVNSGISRTLAGSEYAERRRACEALARELGVPALRDADEAQVVDHPLGRHVVSENRRVLDAADALADGDFPRLGELLLESHASLRDDFAVSTPELDVLVSELVDAGAFGARLTGAGFGGCVVAVCRANSADAVAAKASARYRERVGRQPMAFICRAAGGAHAMPARA
jgi:galactokinase